MNNTFADSATSRPEDDLRSSFDSAVGPERPLPASKGEELRSARTVVHAGHSRIEIAGDRAVSVNVEVGATIQCVSGRLWLTQEGDARDYSVPAGVTFCADRSGRAVLSAIGGPSVVTVREARAARSGCVPGTLTIDSIERITRDARAAQSAYFASVLTRMAASLFKKLSQTVGAGRATHAPRSKPCPEPGALCGSRGDERLAIASTAKRSRRNAVRQGRTKLETAS
jgi:hypothetical protein